MCGIYGIAFLENMTVRPKILRKILKNLALEAQSRGRDATGYAFTSDNGIVIFKNNLRASEFTEMENYRSTVKKYLATDKMPYSIIGHTRAQTKGSHENPDNNHPIRTGNIVGVHNGMIYNDDTKFSWLKNMSNGKVKRIAQVDSEIIFSLINYHAKSFKFPSTVKGERLIGSIGNPTSKAIAKAAGELVGSYACASVDSENPKILWLFKATGQLAVYNYEDEGLIMFASTENIIDNSVRKFGFSKPTTIKVDRSSGLCINTESRTYNSFDLDIEDNMGGAGYYGY